MSSKSALYRKRLRDTNDPKYEEYLKRMREREQKKRDEERKRWEEEPRTRAMELKHEARLQQMREYRARKRAAAGIQTRGGSLTKVDPNRKKPRDMMPEEFKLHSNRLRQESRARMSAQKRRRHKEKDREYQRQKRARARTSSPVVTPQRPALQDTPPAPHTFPTPPAPHSFPTPPAPHALPTPPIPHTFHTPPAQSTYLATPPGPLIPPTPPTPRFTKKTLYNKTHQAKKATSGVTPDEYAQIMKRLVCPRTPEKRAAVNREIFSQPGQQEIHEPARNPRTPARRPGKVMKKSRRVTVTRTARDRLHQQVKVFYAREDVFYTREDVSRSLPHRRYTTKKGPAYVMNVTMRGAFRQFVEEFPLRKVGYTLFCRLRPKSVRKLGTVPVDTCLCMYCLNVRYKLDAVNRLLSRQQVAVRFPAETKLLDVICCPRQEGALWPEMDCVLGTCSACQDVLEPFNALDQFISESVSWTHWGRSRDRQTYKLDVFAKTGTVGELLLELRDDLERPSKGQTFKRHLFTAFWQYRQFRFLKNSLQEDEVLMVMDFAENRKAEFSAEIKSAHFGKSQITLHPVVVYMRSARNQLVRHSLMFLSDDIAHDYHAVNHFTLAALDYVKEQCRDLKRVILFSDGCAAQYKGRGTFADLSLMSGLSVQRAYYGSEHGKGEADGETGVLSQMLTRAVQGGRATIRNAQDLFEWGQLEMERSTPLDARKFFIVGRHDIRRDRPETDVSTLPGTRQFHQVERLGDYRLRCRKLACFCCACRMDKVSLCVNKPYVGEIQLSS